MHQLEFRGAVLHNGLDSQLHFQAGDIPETRDKRGFCSHILQEAIMRLGLQEAIMRLGWTHLANQHETSELELESNRSRGREEHGE